VVYGAAARIFQPAAHFVASESKGGEMNILKEKNVPLRKTYFQLLNQTKLSSTNRCDFWKLIPNFRLVPPL
jgi:hypothetical protein